jgi:hypothetical protein
MPLPLAGESFETFSQTSHPTYIYTPARNTLVKAIPRNEIYQSPQNVSKEQEKSELIDKIVSKKLNETFVKMLSDYRLNCKNINSVLKLDRLINFDDRFKIPKINNLKPYEQLTIHDLNKSGIFIPLSCIQNEKVAADGLYITHNKCQIAEIKSIRDSINTKNFVKKFSQIADSTVTQIDSTIPNLPIKNKLGIIDVYTQEGLLTPIDFVAGINYAYEHEPSILPLRIRALDISCRGQSEFSDVLFEVRCNPKPNNSSISPRIFTLKEFDSSLIC